MITIIILLSNLLALQDKENTHTISVQVTTNKLWPGQYRTTASLGRQLTTSVYGK